jgi:hypothetical protein
MVRLVSIDTLTGDYNNWSPYVFSGNRGIDARELKSLNHMYYLILKKRLL